ncbi:MAG: hypothetical protein IPK22_13710 [Verrucomicrobiaceae bacterium]|nr:hypothetical protein [Verrucomicrobiaceae bacterium]
MKTSSIISMLIGVLIGGTAVVMFDASFPPPEGSAEEKAAQLESELTRAQSRIAKLEAQIPAKGVDLAATARGGISDILDDIKQGRPVDLEKLHHRLKPALREITPLFDLLRRRELKKEHARIAAHMGEAYKLNEAQQKALQQWLDEQAAQDAEKFLQTAYGENSRLEDLVKSMKHLEPRRGMDEFMERTLTGQEKQRYVSDRLAERAVKLENDANNRLQRLHQAVPLDQAQQDRVFAIMARSSPDYDPRLQLDIPLGNDAAHIRPGADRAAAIMQVLRPDQRLQYEAYQQSQREAANRTAAEAGFKLPENWDVFEEW